MPDDRTRLDADLKRALEEFEAAKFPRIRPLEWRALDDLQIDLDLDGGDGAGLGGREYGDSMWVWRAPRTRPGQVTRINSRRAEAVVG